MDTALDPPPHHHRHHHRHPAKPNPEHAKTNPEPAKPNPGSEAAVKSNQFLKPKFPNATKISVGEDTYTIGKVLLWGLKEECHEIFDDDDGIRNFRSNSNNGAYIYTRYRTKEQTDLDCVDEGKGYIYEKRRGKKWRDAHSLYGCLLNSHKLFK